MEHHDIATFMLMARRRKPSPHLEHCAFCREQYEYALDLLEVLEGTGAELHGGSEALLSRPYPYRLAAQTAESATPLFRLRRTWYLRNNDVILRVIEDTVRHRLTGYLIADLDPDRNLRIRFDGLETEFRPDGNGVFDIGASSIDIEPMNVTIVS